MAFMFPSRVSGPAQFALAGLPGMHGPQHFGFTVPDRQAAVDFFVEVIGREAFFTIWRCRPLATGGASPQPRRWPWDENEKNPPA